MKYMDPVYGSVIIEEPVILELLKSKPLQRLKDVSQHGASIYNRGYVQRRITRFEHSLGVYLLLRKFNCPLEEQVAGLLHDVGHTAFSHVIDYLFVDGKHEYDKMNHGEMIRKSEIPKILKKHGIDVEETLDDSNFPAMEKPLPAICADRIDYFLRDYSLFKKTDKDLVLNSLEIWNKSFVFNNRKAAAYYAKGYIDANEIFWRNPFHEYLYHTLVDILALSLKKKVILKTDLFKTEEIVMEKINKSGDKEIKELLKTLTYLKAKNVVWSYIKKPFKYHVKSKARVVDPPVLVKDTVKKLSEIDPGYKKIFAKTMKDYIKDRWIGLENWVNI